MALGLCMRGGGGICADQHAFKLLIIIAINRIGTIVYQF